MRSTLEVARDGDDDEIARLREALRQATHAAMAYARTSVAALASMKQRLDEVEGECARARAEDAATIEALRADVEELSTRACALTRERDEALMSLANVVRAGEDDATTKASASAPGTLSDEDAVELELVKQRCEVAEKMLNDLREEGLCLADEATKASERNEELSKVLRVMGEAKKDLAAAHDLVVNRHRHKVESSLNTANSVLETVEL